MRSTQQQIEQLKAQWAHEPRWKTITRPYSAADVVRLRGSKPIAYTLARDGAEKLWRLLNEQPFVNALGALTGNQAMQQVKAGLKAIYLSGWQVAGDANLAGEMYPDQSLYPVNSVPVVVKRINNTLQRADQIQQLEGGGDIDWFAPTFVLSLTGLPVASAPCGLDARGLPVGMQIVGRPRGEGAVLCLARLVQDLCPTGLPTLD